MEGMEDWYYLLKLVYQNFIGLNDLLLIRKLDGSTISVEKGRKWVNSKLGWDEWTVNLGVVKKCGNNFVKLEIYIKMSWIFQYSRANFQNIKFYQKVSGIISIESNLFLFLLFNYVCVLLLLLMFFCILFVMYKGTTKISLLIQITTFNTNFAAGAITVY